jgi:hypothetical protein
MTVHIPSNSHRLVQITETSIGRDWKSQVEDVDGRVGALRVRECVRPKDGRRVEVCSKRAWDAFMSFKSIETVLPPSLMMPVVSATAKACADLFNGNSSPMR